MISNWERQTGHVAYVCRCNRHGCQFCDGGLTACDTCGGFEGSLLPYCPGRRLTPDEDARNYQMYCDRIGPFARSTRATVDAAKHACYWRLHPTIDVDTSNGARQLYDAVCELWRETFRS